jgi:hypothetical protein
MASSCTRPRLLKEFQSRGSLVRAFYYTPISEDQENSPIRPLSSVAAQKSANLAEGSPWPAVLMSAVVLVAGIAGQHHFVARPGRRPFVRDKSLDTASLFAIMAICGLGLLVSLCAAIYG